MRDRFSNLAAVCDEETMSKVGTFICLCLVLSCFGRTAADLFWSLGGRGGSRLRISRRWRSVWRGVIGGQDDEMQCARIIVAWQTEGEHVFPFLSRLVSRRPRPALAASMTKMGRDR